MPGASGRTCRKAPAGVTIGMGTTRVVMIPGPAGRIEGIVQGEGPAVEEEAADSSRAPGAGRRTEAVQSQGPGGGENAGVPGGAARAGGHEGIAPPRRLAVVCHPHPLGGGTMHTKVVHRTARALQEAGHCVLRFNFRGVGASEGAHDGGDGEREDVRAAISWLLGRHPGLPMTVAGFSFGSWVGLRVGCEEPAADALIGIAAPAGLYDFGFLRRCSKPKLFVHGTEDELAPFAAFEEIFAGLPEPKRLVALRGGDHMLVDRLDELVAAVRGFAGGLPEAAAR